MSVDTLYNSQRTASDWIGADYRDVQELQEPRIAMESTITIDGHELTTMRCHSGDASAGLGAKGGIRMYDGYVSVEAARANGLELAVEMLSKLAIRGHGGTFIGGKGVIMLSSHAPFALKRDAMRQFEEAMDDAGLAGYNRDVPAGDVGVGSNLTDTYAAAYRQNNPNDTRWQAVITGKSPAYGGAEFRPAATGWGSYITQRTVMQARGQQVARTTVQGFGNVGGYHAYFASNDAEGRMPVDAISDADGIIYTDAPEGIKITDEMLQRIANNPDFAADPEFAEFHGQKIAALGALVTRNQPGLDFRIAKNPAAIISRPTGYFVPAAMGNVITEYNVQYLGARDGVIEASNGPTTPAAHRYLTERQGLLVMPDIVANGAGVDGSIQEWNANLRGELLTATEQQAMLTATSERVVRETLQTARTLGTPDMRVAAAGLGIARLFEASRPEFVRELLAA